MNLTHSDLVCHSRGRSHLLYLLGMYAHTPLPTIRPCSHDRMFPNFCRMCRQRSLHCKACCKHHHAICGTRTACKIPCPLNSWLAQSIFCNFLGMEFHICPRNCHLSILRCNNLLARIPP